VTTSRPLNTIRSRGSTVRQVSISLSSALVPSRHVSSYLPRSSCSDLSPSQLLVECRNYSHITTYVFKADSALESGNPPGSTTTKKLTPERERYQTQLDLCTALSTLASSNYDKAAYHLLRLGAPKNLADCGWAGLLVSPGDVAIIGTLCALASMTRSAIKAQILENDAFGIYLEHEPYVRELIDAYLGSQFKTVLELLEKFSVRSLLLPKKSGGLTFPSHHVDPALRRHPLLLARPRRHAPHPLAHDGPVLQALCFDQA
jgi:hypothetical protein